MLNLYTVFPVPIAFAPISLSEAYINMAARAFHGLYTVFSYRSHAIACWEDERLMAKRLNWFLLRSAIAIWISSGFLVAFAEESDSNVQARDFNERLHVRDNERREALTTAHRSLSTESLSNVETDDPQNPTQDSPKSDVQVSSMKDSISSFSRNEDDVSVSSSTEKMRRMRMRLELKNEAALLEKLEALRLRDESNRLTRLGLF